MPKKGYKMSAEHKAKIGAANKGKAHTPEARSKISLAKLGNTCRRGKKTPPSGIEKIRQARLGKPLYKLRGPNSHFWRGGVTEKNAAIRQSLEYRLWRTAVFERDGYRCIWCGDSSGGNLNADHIKPFSLYPELRFAIDNGRTLCRDCHMKTDTYGSKALKFKNNTSITQ